MNKKNICDLASDYNPKYCTVAQKCEYGKFYYICPVNIYYSNLRKEKVLKK